MTSPKHLWSDDWQTESARRAAELAARRGAQPEPEVAEPPPAPPPRPTLTDHIRRLLAVLGGALAGLRRRVQPRVAAPIALLVVVIVAAAFALSSITGGGSKSTVINGVTSASLKLADQLLGAQLAAVPPRGVAIDTLDPGGPSETAGLEPGDVITAINGRPIEGSGDVAAAVRGLHGGEPVVVQVSRGSSIYSTLVAVATPGHP